MKKLLFIALAFLTCGSVDAANFNKRLRLYSQDYTTVKVIWTRDYVTLVDSVTLTPKDTFVTLDDAYNWQLEFVWTNATGDTVVGTQLVQTRANQSLASTQSFSMTGNITGNLSGSVGSVTTAVPVNFSSITGTLDAAEIGTDAITATKIAAAAITSSEAPNLDVAVSTRGTSTLAATDNIGINWGDITNPTTAQGLSGTTISTAQTVASVSGAVGSVTGAVASVTAGVTTTTADKDALVDLVWNEDSTGHYTSPNMAFTSAQTAASGLTVSQIWNEAKSGYTTPGTFGYYLDAQVSAAGGGAWSTAMADSMLVGLWRTSGSGANIWGNNIGINWADVSNPTTSLALTNTTINDVTGSVDISATSIDLMWDEVQAGHITAGSFGLYLDALISSRLAPTTSGRTLDVTTTGETGVDLSNVAGTLDAAEIGTDAITSTKIAASAITSSEAPNLDAAISTRSTYNPVTDSTLTDGSALLALKLDDGVSGTDSTLLPWLRAGAAAGAGGGATVAQIWGELQAGYVTPGTFGYNVDAQISGISGGAGTGAYTYAITLKDTSAVPDVVISGTQVRINNTTQTGQVYYVTTNTSGVASFNLNAGQWVVFTTDPRFVSNIDTITVAAVGGYTLNEAAAVLIDTDTNTTTVAFYINKPDGTANDSAQVNIELRAIHPDSLLRVANVVIAATYRQMLVRADANGRALIDLYGNALFTNDSTYYRATIKNRYNDKLIDDFKFRVPTVTAPSDTVHYINNLPRWK